MTIKKSLGLLAFVSLMGVGVAGCGSSQATSAAVVPTPHSAAKTSHHHPGKLGHVKGTVTQVTASQLLVKNAKNKTLTFTLGSHTKYRQKKVTITLSKITTGSTVTVAFKKISGHDVAFLVRLL